MPDRTPQQALKDAIDSGAVDAWINGEEIQYSLLDKGEWKDGGCLVDPRFRAEGLQWRPTPPEPTKINWRPVVTGKEPKGKVIVYCQTHIGLGTHSADGWISPTGKPLVPPTHWAPMCNLPEGGK